MGEAESKEERARVRDELLQKLYGSVLRCTLGRAQAGGPARDAAHDALAAGVCATLAQDDLLLVPARGGGPFRVLRGTAYHGGVAGQRRDLDAGVLTLPREEARAVSLALGAAAATGRKNPRALVAVLLPSPVSLETTGRVATDPASWAEAAAYAARWALPILFLSGPARALRAGNLDGRPEPRRPAPPFPSIPVDREDPLAIYRVAHECAVRARAEGGGPSHVEAVPFRVRGQQGEELGALARLEAALRKRGAFSKAWRRQLERAAVAEYSS